MYDANPLMMPVVLLGIRAPTATALRTKLFAGAAGTAPSTKTSLSEQDSSAAATDQSRVGSEA